MPSWAVVVIAVVLVLAAGFLREHFRVGAIQRWCPTRGFRYSSPPDASEAAALNALAALFHPRTISQWGVVLRQDDGGVETTIAEHAERTRRGGTRWYSLAAIRVPGARFGRVRIVPAPSSLVSAATDSLTAPGRAAGARLGIEVAERPGVHSIGRDKWAVETDDPAALAFWTSDAHLATLERLSDDGPLASSGDQVVVRVPGLLTAARLDALLPRLAEARTIFEGRPG